MSTRRVQSIIEQFNSSYGLPFQQLLPQETIEQFLAVEKIKYRQRLFTPIVTLWTFLSQVLAPDKTCHNAVSRVIAWLASEGKETPSSDPSAYCQARQRLPEKFLKKLIFEVAQKLERETQYQQWWCGRRVKVIDGSSVSMPDTKANQKAYPQPNSQKAGCGFPLAKIVVLFSLTTGAAIDILIDKFNVSELKLARQLYLRIEPGDVWLGDRAFGSYADVSQIYKRRADGVFSKHQSRKDSRIRGKRTGPNDKLVTWYKPKYCPQGLCPKEYEQLPETLTVREVHCYLEQPGWRSQEITLITTLLNAELYSRSDLLKLYRWRWQVELYLRHLKTTLGMDILQGKTPSLVRKEVYVHLLAYNLLRSWMWQAGMNQKVEPLLLSLQKVRHHLNNWVSELKNSSLSCRPELRQKLWQLMVHQPLQLRKPRSEPRVRKRRPKSYPLMTQPRSVLRQKIV